MANKQASAATTATEALKIHWEDGFFTSWRKFGAIEAQLAKRGNHFSVPELGMALKRAKHLVRRGKQGSYEYIQKYPASAVESPTKAKKKAKT
ncbi:MAG: hypothetical protein WCA78_16660 [Rhizomicrobium sp.]